MVSYCELNSIWVIALNLSPDFPLFDILFEQAAYSTPIRPKILGAFQIEKLKMQHRTHRLMFYPRSLDFFPANSSVKRSP